MTSPDTRVTAAGHAHRPATSIVAQAMVEARRTMTLALTVSWLLLGLLVAERAWIGSSQRAAAQHQSEVLRVAGALRLADERLTASARLAVSTAEPIWVTRFDEQRPALEGLLEEAARLAPPDVSARFETESRAAYVELTDMREAAFEAVSIGEAAIARSIFDGERYLSHAAKFDLAIGRFIGATIAAAEAERDAVHARTAVVGATMLAGLILLGLWQARHLGRVRDSLMHAERRVQRLALTDPLTSLPNRTGLHEAMASELDAAQREARGLSVLMIDLDRFKPVNDRHGHAIGDRVLEQAGRRLSEALGPGRVVARYGGDEFVVVVPDGTDATPARQVAESVVAALARPLALDELELTIGATIGIARFPADGLTSDDLLRKADSALCRAKRSQRGGVVLYDRLLDEHMAERTRREQELREALGRNEFVAHLQPIVDLATRQVQSVEVLARWAHPTRGLVPPAEFIPLAEDSGLIDPMTIAVLGSACEQMRRLPAHWRLSINVAPQQMLDATLAMRLSAVLGAHGLSPLRLDVELTETALVQDLSAARQVTQQLKDTGFTVTLDDFGTGYSSLAYLADLAFDRIKIDRSFVRTLHARPQSAQIVGAVIGLSRSMGVQVVAEGIESEDDARRLHEMGCPLGQGYWFGRPAPADALLQALQATTAPSIG